MTQLLNSPIEVGVRVVAILEALYPRDSDLDRIVLLDHIVLHGVDLGGEPRVHPDIPGRAAEMGIKRGLVREAIQLMGARGLIARQLTPAGVRYTASEDARPFLDSIDAQYLARVRRRSALAAEVFGDLPDAAIRDHIAQTLGQWSEEFDEPNYGGLSD